MQPGTLSIAARVVALAACASAPAFAHEGVGARSQVPHDLHELAGAWGFDPLVLVLLALTAVLYVRGLARTWRAAGVGHGIRRSECACFAAGFVVLLIAQVSPLHRLGGALFSAHMTEHELLMLVASPLLVLGKPLVAFLRALPAGTARALVAATRAPLWQRIWRFLVTPGIAFALHALALWIWHLPSWFEAALASDTIHALQHLSFVSTALLFWWADMHGEQRMARYGAALLFLFATALHTGLLGALLAFSGHAFYPTYLETSRAWGVGAHSDQQLGGLIMWIPACALYIFAALALCVGWLRAAERGVERWEATLQPDLSGEGSAR